MRIDAPDDASGHAPDDAAPIDGDATQLVRVLYERHAADLHGYLARRVGAHVADDLLADTFSSAIAGWDGYDPKRGSELNWLYGIATNLVRRHWRTERRRHVAISRAAAQRSGAGGTTDDHDDPVIERLGVAHDMELLLDAVAELDAEDRDLLVLIAWERKTSADAAEILGIAPGTARSRLHRIRRRLDGARRRTGPRHAEPRGDSTS